MTPCCTCPPAPAQVLDSLSQLQLTALEIHGSFWLAVNAATADLLERCSTGLCEGGPATAADVAAALQAALATLQSTGNTSLIDREAAGIVPQPGDACSEPGVDPQQPPPAPAPTLPTATAGGGAAAVVARGGVPQPPECPCPVRLRPEEAFFLAYVLRCLTVISAQVSESAPVYATFFGFRSSFCCL